MPSGDSQFNPPVDKLVAENKNLTDRAIRGYSILAKGDMPKLISEEEFLVPSQSDADKRYKVSHKTEWTCDCPDFKKRGMKCKHIYAVEFLLKMRAKIDADSVLDFSEERDKPKCAYCDSQDIVKNGTVKNKSQDKQRFLCRDCNKTFYKDRSFNYLRANPKVVTLCLDLYYKGLSLRKVADTLNQFFGVKIHHETVRRWIMKFTQAINEYTDKFKPEVSNEMWQADEQAIKSEGKIKWSWNIIDPKTRFLIANVITEGKTMKETLQIFKRAKEVTDIVPDAIITDGLRAYPEAVDREFNRRETQKRVEHIKLKSIRFKPLNTNKVERYQGTFRDRDKVMRGFKGGEQLMASGFRTYYNFVKQHHALEGLTPSQMAGIELGLNRNRWLSLIRMGSE